jgi:hypothetical protein
MKQIALLVAFLFFVVSITACVVGVAPPPLEFAAPPDVVVVPYGESYVYMVPDTLGVYFYGGYWYRTYRDRWYRCNIYSGPWAYRETSLIPRVVINVPPDYYRRLPSGYPRIHYDDLNRNWQTWDRDRYWHTQDWYKDAVREHEKWRDTEGRQPEGERYNPREQRQDRERHEQR